MCVPACCTLQMYQRKRTAFDAQVEGSVDPGTKGKLQLQSNSFYRLKHEQCKALYKVEPGKPLPAGMDPQDNTEQATFTLDELVKLCDMLLVSKEWRASRDLSMLLWMCNTCGRGDDARPRRLCELTEPKHRATIGE